MTIKRSRVYDREVEALAMANCFELLSRVGPKANLDGRVFQCKTCNKKFPSSQALGGHRARHKMPCLSSIVNDHHLHKSPRSPVPEKPSSTTYECSICGLHVAVRQALGGHMRRHRGDTKEEQKSCVVEIEVNSGTVPLLKRSNSSKKVMCLDLNLTPYENDLKLQYYQIQSARGL